MTTSGIETQSGRQDYHSLGLSVKEKTTQFHFQTLVLFSVTLFREKKSNLMVIIYLSVATVTEHYKESVLC